MLVFNNFSNPQLGRWWQIDPEVEQFEAWSAYNSNLDNPILHTDPEGDCTDCPSGTYRWRFYLKQLFTMPNMLYLM